MGGPDVSASAMVGAAVKVMDPSKMIDGVSPTVAMRFRLLVLGLALLGYGRARVTSGRRSLDSEMVLYGKGRTQEECLQAGVPKIYARPAQKRVVWVRPAESKHLTGMAVDVYWGSYKRVAWSQVERVADDLGLMWGGSWKVRDYGHFEI